MKRFLIPLALSQLADVVTTWISLSLGGYEANPVARYLINTGGLALLGSFKVIIVVIATLALHNAFLYGGRLLTTTKAVIVGVTAATFLVAAWNILVAYAAWTL